MPQIFPMNWLLLYILIFFMLIFISFMIYFNYNSFPQSKMIVKNYKTWKW
uniref:ATP synthase F0 subunit 8 n=1 Tax=Cerophytidae sp. BMNH 900085 TaxID=1903808 RepID=A0A343A4I6_9COLE|nr:ATP synthase F0 subunit 8 [Cerophytidae sp. BMNH 900085]